MSNSTVRLYDLLKSEYPGKVYLGQIDQSVDLRSSNGIILLQEINETPTSSKDVIKRDKVVYNIQVIGTIQKTVDAISSNIRDIVEPYNDEYIMLMVYDSMAKNYDEDAEIYAKVLQFTCWPEPDGLNKPTEYYEHIVKIFDNGSYEILNINERNYLPIIWSYNYEEINSHNRWESLYTYADSDVYVYQLCNDGKFDPTIDTLSNNGTLTIIKIANTGAEDQTFLIRVRKDINGQFISGT